MNLAFFRREDEDDSSGPQEIPQLDGGDTDDSEEEEEEPADDSEDEDFVPSSSAARASTSRRADRTERSAKRSLARYRTITCKYRIIFLSTLLTLLHLPPLSFHCVGGSKTRTVAITALTVRRSRPHSSRSHPQLG